MPSVLIVDAFSLHGVLADVLRPLGFTTTFAVKSAHGLSLFQAGRYDLVLIDIDVKPLDGIALLQEIHRHDPSVAVIVLTSYVTADRAEQALQCGAAACLQKPFRRDGLLAAIDDALRSTCA